jgi:hypothetical protein
MGIQQLYVNFQIYDVPSYKNKLIDAMTRVQAETFVIEKVLPVIEKMFDNETAFLADLIDSLKRVVMGESLSDNQKYLISTEKPFLQSKGL